MMYNKNRITLLNFYFNTKIKGLFEMVKSKYNDNTIFNRKKLLFIYLDGKYLSLYAERYFYNGKRKIWHVIPQLVNGFKPGKESINIQITNIKQIPIINFK